MSYLSKAVVGILGFSTVVGGSLMRGHQLRMRRSEIPAVRPDDVISMKGSVLSQLSNSACPKNNTSVSRMPIRTCEDLCLKNKN